MWYALTKSHVVIDSAGLAIKKADYPYEMKVPNNASLTGLALRESIYWVDVIRGVDTGLLWKICLCLCGL